MPDDGEIASPAPAPSAQKRGRGRPPVESPQQRIERLQAELQKAHDAKKTIDRQRAEIVGAAVLCRAGADENFRRQLASILSAEIKHKPDLAVISDLLA